MPKKRNLLLLGVNSTYVANLIKSSVYFADFNFTEYESVATLIKSANKKELFSGLVTDLKFLMKLSEEDKLWVNRNFDLFPMLRLRINQEKLEAQNPECLLNNEIELIEFSNKASVFVPKGIRREPRSQLHLNFQMSYGDTWNPNEVISVTSFDISKSGAFIVDQNPMPDVKKLVLKLVGPNVIDNQPRLARVVWNLPWGKNTHTRMSGWGVEFEQRIEELGDLLLSYQR